jgi:hypothetical protein
MAGGKIQGNQKPKSKLTADEIIARAKESMSSFMGGSPGTAPTREITNFGPPSPDNERPIDDSGERDLTAIAPGRRSPFSKP